MDQPSRPTRSKRGTKGGARQHRLRPRTPHELQRRHPGRLVHATAGHHGRTIARRGGGLALLAVVGPGLLAGLSDDDPAGITTYSIAGAQYGYQLLWVLVASTAALIVFHELGSRMGVVTGKGLLTLVRERFGPRAAVAVASALIVANTGTMCAEFAGVSAGMSLLAGMPPWITVPTAGVLVSALVLRGSFHRVEHVLLALSSVFVAYVVSGVLSHPDIGAAAQGLVLPTMPLTKAAALTVVATIGTTLAPWGLAFIQSYAADKRLRVADLNYERIDVIAGAVLTGVIGVFIVVACAATLHVRGIEIDDARDAAIALEPAAGQLAATLFGFGFVGAALLASAIVPLSTAYSVSEAMGHPAKLDDAFHESPMFYATFLAVMGVAGVIVLIPGVPLVPILFLSQALNAVLLLAILPVMRRLGSDRELMGVHVLGRAGRATTGVMLALVAASVLALLGLSVT